MTRFRISLALAALFSSALPVAASAQSSGSRYDYFQAIKKGDGATVQRMIDTPGSTIVNVRDNGENGETALFLKTQSRELNWMSYLLSRGANPDIADKDGETPLHIATQLNFTEGVKLLLDYKADIDARNRFGETPLIRAVRMRQTDMVKLLLRRGANPDLTDNASGRSARDYATDDPRGQAMADAIAQVEIEKKIEKKSADERKADRDPFDFSGDFLPVE